MSGALESLSESVEALRKTVEQQTEEIRSLHERVEPLKSFYSIKELWRLLVASFQRSRDLPPPDGYFRKQRAYKRETVLAYMAKFTERRKK